MDHRVCVCVRARCAWPNGVEHTYVTVVKKNRMAHDLCVKFKRERCALALSSVYSEFYCWLGRARISLRCTLFILFFPSLPLRLKSRTIPLPLVGVCVCVSRLRQHSPECQPSSPTNFQFQHFDECHVCRSFWSYIEWGGSVLTNNLHVCICRTCGKCWRINCHFAWEIAR